MTIHASITIGPGRRISVNPNPIRVNWRTVEEIEWKIIGAPGWRFAGKDEGIVIDNAGKTFTNRLAGKPLRWISMLDWNHHMVSPTKGRNPKRRKPGSRRFKYTIKLVKVDARGRVMDDAELDPAIENQGC